MAKKDTQDTTQQLDTWTTMHLDNYAPGLRVATKCEKKIPQVFQVFPKPMVFQRLSQQKVHVIMTTIYQESFHINYYSCE